MFLPDAYKQCPCGEKLNRRNRFAVRLSHPEHINTEKRDKEGKQYHSEIVNYVCETCHEKLHEVIPNLLGYNKPSWFIYYPSLYGVNEYHHIHTLKPRK